MSDNIFKEVLTDAKAAKHKYFGDEYPYYKYIKTPEELGMSSKGSLKVLGKDIDGLIEYVNVLVTGKSEASKTGKPLGNKFFIKTGAKCSDSVTGEEKDRHVYINNVPMGNIPFISSGMGVNFSEFRGLLPGTISNLNAFNPAGLFQAFLEGSKPKCQEITMETIDIDNNISTETQYVTLVDIRNMDPCGFKNKKNPITSQKCKETFQNIFYDDADADMNIDMDDFDTSNLNYFKIPNDYLSQLFFISFGIFGIYLLHKLLQKNKMMK
jgi:hypothetical protein